MSPARRFTGTDRATLLRAQRARERSLRRELAVTLRGVADLVSDFDRRLGVAMGGQVPATFIRDLHLYLQARQRALAGALVEPVTRAGPGSEPRFGLSAAELALQQAGVLVQGLEQRQLVALRVQLATLMQVGPSTEFLDALAHTVGLTDRQARQVARVVQGQLAAGASQAAAARVGRQVTERLLAYRARLIARHEATQYTNDLVLQRARAAGGRVLKQSVSARDGHVDEDDPIRGPCIINDNGQRIPLEATFPSGHSRPPYHIGCRCLLEIWVAEQAA